MELAVLAIRYAPTIKRGASEVIAGAQQIWDSATADHPPTEEEQAQYDAALKEAHDALQNS
jgi:hypothetical protein